MQWIWFSGAFFFGFDNVVLGHALQQIGDVGKANKSFMILGGIHWHEMDGILSSLRPHHGLPWLSFFKNGNARVLLGGIKRKYGDALSLG